jgi:hypothetical protein
MYKKNLNAQKNTITPKFCPWNELKYVLNPPH